MAYTIERTFVRPDTSTAWPWDNFGVDKEAEISALRSTHSVTRSEGTLSSDGLSMTYTESCPSFDAYRSYHTEAKSVWVSGGIITEENATGVTNSTSASNGVTVNISVLENT